MLADDRVLVGIINRKTDLDHLLQDHWYRIPQKQMPDGIFAEYVAFFLSGTASKRFGDSGIYYFARRHGLELAYRKDLLPYETSKKALARANDPYYKVQFRQIQGKVPPIINPDKRRFAFIHTTWDRFVNASEISDLYSKNDYFVDRIYHALRDKQIRVDRYWDAQRTQTGYGASVRIICEHGTLLGYTEENSHYENGIFLDSQRPDDEIFAEIQAKMAQMDEAVSAPLSTIY